MTFLESVVRPLLVVHAIAAAVLVGATTHHFLWSRRYWRGNFRGARSEQRFAAIAAAAFSCTFVLGSLLYPTYKVRVRAEYFDNPVAVGEEARLRAAQRHSLGAPTRAAPPETLVRSNLTWVARLFDIKEHWVALGCAASLLLLGLSIKAHPKDHPAVVPLYLGLSLFACATAWWGAIAGLITASFRAVGGVW